MTALARHWSKPRSFQASSRKIVLAMDWITAALGFDKTPLGTRRLIFSSECWKVHGSGHGENISPLRALRFLCWWDLFSLGCLCTVQHWVTLIWTGMMLADWTISVPELKPNIIWPICSRATARKYVLDIVKLSSLVSVSLKTRKAKQAGFETGQLYEKV